MKRLAGFTLVELMVSLVAGSVAAIAAFSLGAGLSRQFFEQQRVSLAQGAARVSLAELERDIARAGLFGTPNADLEPTCDQDVPELPMLDSSGAIVLDAGPIAAFQYYPGMDTGVLDDEDMTTANPAANPGVRGDRLRLLSNLSITDALTVETIRQNQNGTFQQVFLNEEMQSFRRTFLWGATGTYGTLFGPTNPQVFLKGTRSLDDGGSTAARYSARGERAFSLGTILHFEAPSGQHFFRTVRYTSQQGINSAGGGTIGRLFVRIGEDLPVGTTCLPGNGQGTLVAPLEWIEYAVVDPFAINGGNFMNFGGSLHLQFNDAGGVDFDWSSVTASQLLESPNPMLVRRRLDAATGAAFAGGVQVIAEFVSSFKVSFLVDRNTTAGAAPDIVLMDADADATAVQTFVNERPQDVRSVIIELAVRNPGEDPSLRASSVPDSGTRFDIDDATKGSSRVQTMRVEVPVGNVARRNL